MGYNTLIVEKTEGVMIITLNRPKTLNAWDREMGLETTDALDDARRDSDVKVVVMTGAGRGFSSGADMRHLSQIPEQGSQLGMAFK